MRSIRNVLAGVARAAATKSKFLTWVVTVSATRQIGGINISVSEITALKTPEPNAPEMAIANKIDGNA